MDPCTDSIFFFFFLSSLSLPFYGSMNKFYLLKSRLNRLFLSLFTFLQSLRWQEKNGTKNATLGINIRFDKSRKVRLQKLFPGQRTKCEKKYHRKKIERSWKWFLFFSAFNIRANQLRTNEKQKLINNNIVSENCRKLTYGQLDRCSHILRTAMNLSDSKEKGNFKLYIYKYSLSSSTWFVISFGFRIADVVAAAVIRCVNQKSWMQKNNNIDYKITKKK